MLRILEAVRPLSQASRFVLMLCIPLLGPLGHLARLPWASPFAVFVLVPLLDLVLGEDHSNEQGRPAKVRCRYHDAIPVAYLIIWLACLGWTGWWLQSPSISVEAMAALLVAAGIASAFATCAAHELVHRPEQAMQWAARLTMSMCCYGHFVVEHLHHHATAGRLEKGTVPKPGESVYAFILRNAWFSYGNAYRIADGIRRRHRHHWTSNRVVRQHTLSLLLFIGSGALFGRSGLVLFATQALIAIATVEMVQYFEHYALLRRDGEPLGIQHAWNSNGWMTNAITLNITRHSDHHMDARIPYQALRMLPQAPQMPCGYFGLAWIALVPPVWRAVIDRRLQEVAAPQAVLGDGLPRQ